MERPNGTRFGGLSVTTEVGDDAVVVRVSGELDLATAPHLRERLAQAAGVFVPPNVVVDVEELAFCDSTGLSVFTTALTGAEAAGGRLTLTGIRGQLARVLKITGLDEKFQVRAAG